MGEDERAAVPQVTISDPHHPGRLVDVVGSGDERDPWRPCRRAMRISAVVVLVLVVVLVPAALLKHRSDERAAATKALAQLDLEVSDVGDPGGYGEDATRLVLKSLGPDPVHVVGVRVDREGYARQKADLRISARGEGALAIALETACPTTPPRSGPTGVLLDVETAHGASTTVRVSTLRSSWSFTYQFAVQTSCHLHVLEESLSVNLGTVALHPRSLDVAIALSNRSSLPRTLESFTAPEGFAVSVSPSLPRLLPAVGANDDLYTLTFTVSDCAKARRLTLLEPEKNAVGQVSADAPTFRTDVLFTISGDGRVARDQPLVRTPEVDSGWATLISRTCP